MSKLAELVKKIKLFGGFTSKPGGKVTDPTNPVPVPKPVKPREETK